VALFAFGLPGVGIPARLSGSGPFILDGNRAYPELALVRPDGTLRNVFALVDLGSASTLLSEELFKELQLDQEKPLLFSVGNMPVRVDSSAVASDAGLPFSLGDNRWVEMLLPAGVLKRFQVAIDYAHRTLTLASPGTLKLSGASVPVRGNEKTGLIAIDVSVNGQAYPVTIDNGSAYTWLQEIRRSAVASCASRLAARHERSRCQQHENGG
jgi:hypothetical protein